jgi:rRNA-processing protein FCF1
MKSLVFDSGPLISLAMNSMLNLIPKLQEKYGAPFYIPSAIVNELVETPSHSKRYAFESLAIKRLIKDGYLEVFNTEHFSEEIDLTLNLANSIFYIGQKNLVILNRGEIETIVIAKNISADAVVVDERTTRVLIENPFRLHRFLEKKFGYKITINKENLREFERHFSTLRIIRSVELALVSVDLGFLNSLIELEMKDKVVEAMLWALKMNGCAVSEMEIKKLVKLYKKGK